MRKFIVIAALMVFFASAVNAAPTVPVPVSPINNELVNTNAPSFQWTGTGATTFKLVVKNELGEKILKQSYDAAEICDGGGNCSAFPGADNWTIDANGTYTWKVVAKDGVDKAKSQSASFILDFPGTPTLLNPADGAPLTTYPLLEWEEVVQADQYIVVIKRASDGGKSKVTLAAGDVCGAVCSYQTTSAEVLVGENSWKVIAKQVTYPNKSKSAKRTFTLSPA